MKQLTEDDTRTLTVSWEDPLAAAARGRELKGIDHLRAIRDGEIPAAPIAVLLGFRPVVVEEGRIVFAGEPGERHYNPIGAVHGGFAATLLDSAMGCAVQSMLPEGSGYTTLGLEVKFVRPITVETGEVHCEATAIHVGRRQATAEGRVVASASGKLLAHGTTTCLVV